MIAGLKVTDIYELVFEVPIDLLLLATNIYILLSGLLHQI